MICSIGAALDAAAAALARAGVENPRLEARLLLGHALGRSQEALLRDRAEAVDTAALEPLLARRVRREPLAYILGGREFWGRSFAVSPATLIPRPDSETLIAAALACFPERSRVDSVLDLGTGTGCLLLAALAEFPDAWGVGVDRTLPAIALARRNAAMLSLQARANFLVGNWADALASTFDLVLSNPPYISSADLAALAPEVAGWEPAAALDGGPDGLAAFRALMPTLPRLLSPGGMAILECGSGQAQRVVGLGRSAGLDPVRIAPDLAGIARAVVFRAESRKKHLALGPEAVSFTRHGRDRRQSADPDAPAGSTIR